MKSLGLIGGTSWHSTVEYYSQINLMVNNVFGNNTNPPLLVVNLNQKEIHDLQKQDEWDSIAMLLTDAAQKLTNAGAEAVMFCANTPHKVYDKVINHISIPVLHIADATAFQMQQKKIKKAGLIGTAYTMEDHFMQDRYAEFCIDTIVPGDRETRKEIQRIIEEELSYGTCQKDSRKFLLAEIALLIEYGAEGIILGCTELPLILGPQDISVPFFDTTLLHARMAVEFILNTVDRPRRKI